MCTAGRWSVQDVGDKTHIVVVRMINLTLGGEQWFEILAEDICTSVISHREKVREREGVESMNDQHCRMSAE